MRTDLPVRRPVAASMFFIALALLGIGAWFRLPIELIPPLEGDELYVNFFRPGSEPELVEQELLLPLEALVSELPDVKETWGEVHGSAGTFRVQFERGTDLKVRELELRRVAGELARRQPRGSFVDVSSLDLEMLSRFVMVIQVSGGGAGAEMLRDVVDERIEPRIASVPGVARVMPMGGAPLEVTVRLDPERCAELGLRPEQAVAALSSAVRRLRYAGSVREGPERVAIVVDGRPGGVAALAELPLFPGRPILLRHVATVEMGAARQENAFRVNGQPAVGLMVFKDEAANLVRAGRDLRRRLAELREEFAPHGIGFEVSFDAAEVVEKQIRRLQKLALSGFLIALAVLLAFLRQWRAVAVVGVAVPVSLLCALGLLLLFGQSINLITLFGLAVAVGMLVDNSIVIYEAVQRLLERGASRDRAASESVRRTLRAILAATATNAIVFVPLLFADLGAMQRGLVEILALALVLPQVGSVLVAVGLVPLLAHRLAAPAAAAALAARLRRRMAFAGMSPPDRGRELFGGLLSVALRTPGVWLAGTAVAVFLTALFAVPFLAAGAGTGRESAQADTVRLEVVLPGGSSLEAATEKFAALERVVQGRAGIERVESAVQEDGGSLTVYLVERERRPRAVSAAAVREQLHAAAREIEGLELRAPGEGGTGGGQAGEGPGALLGQAAAEVVVSGPDAAQLRDVGRELQARLQSVPEIAWASVSGREGVDELQVLADPRALAASGLTADEVLPALGALRREGVELTTGMTLSSGREIPVVVRRAGREDTSRRDLSRLPVTVGSAVLPLAALADVREVPAPPAIQHHDGRREVRVAYRLGSAAPASGPARIELEQRIKDQLRQAHRPAGTTIETPSEEEALDWFRKILGPAVLLLFGLLALVFESLTLPLLVLVALPLTLIGATWGLIFSGLPADMMALVGAIALMGLTVNPAILLVDRMQERARKGASAGAAALAAVRERTRPVLMTTCTTIAGLWPLALATGEENEIWPPFATVVMGGLVTSTLLTLLVVPVGFVLLSRLDSLLGRLGPYVVLAWGLVTTAVIWPLVQFELLTSLTWQIITTALVGGLLLGVIVLVFRRTRLPEPAAEDGAPPPLEVRFLHKTYGLPGPVAQAWRLPEDFARRVLARGGRPFDPPAVRARLVPLAMLLAGAVYLSLSLQTAFWRMAFFLLAGALAAHAAREVRRARGHADDLGRPLPGGVEQVLAALAPWLALLAIAWLLPNVRWGWLAALAVAIALAQYGRRTAVRVARGAIPDWVPEGRLRRARTLWRRAARRVFGLDLPRREVPAIAGIEFRAARGMIGVLGPNGAGKTTVLRIVAGILDPSRGRATLGGVPLALIRRHLARWVGYLPQDYGLPNELTGREYLDYYALLYGLEPRALREERIARLLDEVGLAQRQDERIGAYSGGMRQRLAVARTLLRLPPVIIVDEPTVGLDPRERIRFRNLLGRLAEGRVVLFSTHVVEDVAVACERVLVLSRGRLVFDGPPEGLARFGEGHAWSVRLAPGEAVPPDALVVDQVPEADGTARARVLCARRPLDSAEPIAPTLEDGYLTLVGAGGMVAGATGLAAAGGTPGVRHA
ncbi:MAG: efflux RND transporter permease subunit [Acidobacteria bacterium]|nr:efflux RND transporter permease subunit [Acidobacteriota bacterium]